MSSQISPRVDYCIRRMHATEANDEDDDDDGEGHETIRLAAIGRAAVGKTCFLRRIVFDDYTGHRVKTRSVDYQTVTIRTRHPRYDRWTPIEVMDTIGDNDMWSANVSHLKRAAGVFLCFDATAPDSYEDCRRWYKMLREQNEWAVCMLVALKSDLYDAFDASDRWMGDYEMEQAAERIGCRAGFCAVSAQNNVGVAEALLRLADCAISTQQTLDDENAAGSARSSVGNVDIAKPFASSSSSRRNRKDGGACCGKQ